MNKHNVGFWMVNRLTPLLLSALLLVGCLSRERAVVGELQSESQSVELADAGPVRVQIMMGAGDLQVTGGAEKLLEADFTYNVARLKPEVKYSNGTLTVRHPETEGLPALQGITGFRNEWDLRLNDQAPMDLRVEVGAGTNDLQLAGLSLTGLDISVGAGSTTIDLSGAWARDLDVSIDAGAGNVTLRLPSQVGVRVEVDAGLGTIDAPGLTKDGHVYTNASYGASEVALRVHLQAGIGQIRLEVED